MIGNGNGYFGKRVEDIELCEVEGGVMVYCGTVSDHRKVEPATALGENISDL